MNELLSLQKEYFDLMSLQVFDQSQLDYSIWERHKAMLAQLAQVSNSGITVFDMNRRKHIFASCSFIDLFGYYVDGIDDRIHPDDLQHQFRCGISALKIVYADRENMRDYRMISEYRIRKTGDEYVRMVEQFSLLEGDCNGNAWLTLSVVDLSPDQSPLKAAKGIIYNTRTKACFDPMSVDSKDSLLSEREISILQMIKDGYISKEISDQLFISIHTVNTHRQRILKKLDVDNSMEAVKYASSLGLLE